MFRWLSAAPPTAPPRPAGHYCPGHRRSATATFAGATVVATLVIFGASLVTPIRKLSARSAKQPNVVIILADDLGYGDVSRYNPERGKIPTPHIDGLAREGMLFSDGHSSSGVCSPSRYTLLTGRYHWRTRLQRGIVGYLERPLIAPDRLTIAGMLRQAGYRTACFGKWHLGWDWNIPRGERPLFNPGRGKFPPVTDRHREAWQRVYGRPIGGGPTTRGFETYFGTDVPNWPPYCFIHNDRTVGIPTEFLPREMFRNHLASLPGPSLRDWDLYAILPTIADRAVEYIRRSAKENRPFFLYLPLTSPHTPLAVAKEWRGRSGLHNAAADFIMQTDAVVGQVLEALASSGVAQDTLVVFTSDNGFAPYVGARALEERGHYPSGPLRGYKGDAWEGGHRVPFIVRWPGVTPAGTTNDQLVHQADLMATVASIVGYKLPPDTAEDSFDLTPLLRGGTEPVRRHAVSQGSQGVMALRDGKWKMIFSNSGGGAWSNLSADKNKLPGQLYDLERDLAESVNLYEREPDRVRAMEALLEKLVSRGRSTAGPEQSNDVPVNWRRFYAAD